MSGRRERVARAIYDVIGPSVVYDFDELKAGHDGQEKDNPWVTSAYEAADAAIAAMHAGTTRVTRFVAGVILGAAVIFVILGIVAGIVALGRWIW